MSVTRDADLIRLEGDCHVEAAETLTGLLQAGGVRGVDLSECARMHGALLQVLLAFRIPVAVAPRDAFLHAYVGPCLERAASAADSSPTVETTEARTPRPSQPPELPR